jgi:biopolymer transport protein ExbB
MTHVRTTAKRRKNVLATARWIGMLTIACVVLMIGARVMAQGTGSAPAAGTAPAASTGATTGGSAPAASVSLMDLFQQSFDLFTVLLLIGSVVGWTIIIMRIVDVRKSTIAPEEAEQVIGQLTRAGRWSELRQFVAEDDAMVSKIVRAAVETPSDDKNAMREAAELAASEESARWFRKLEPLNVIGNLGPLLGLAGTVWGMIIAFAALGQTGGQANPATLSAGISKALFHTLLGLMLAVPCLCVFGFYRSLVDRLCTRAMVVASGLVELLPEDTRARFGGAPVKGAAGAGNAPRAAAPAGPR